MRVLWLYTKKSGMSSVEYALWRICVCVVEYVMRLNYLRVWLRIMEYAFGYPVRVRFEEDALGLCVIDRSILRYVLPNRRFVHKTTLFHCIPRFCLFLLDFLRPI